MLKNIVFDIGGVLLSYKPQEYLVKKYVVDVAWDLLHLIYLSEEWGLLDKGDLTFEEARAKFKAKRPDLSSYIDFLTSRESLTELLQPMPDTVELIKELKNEGRNIYILSNYSPEGFSWLEEKNDFLHLADGVLISGIANISKPAPEIYQLLAHRHKIDPKRSVFFDDNSVNVEAARKEGFHSFVFESPEECRKIIAQLDEKCED
ncbi:MAG: HAD family phosphatase [Clostridiales bacterium]|nr:HAD family phosphatase [Clostridiales bacterium]MDR2752306.1 HAD family phosphatase [Clostridiales bacterium]